MFLRVVSGDEGGGAVLWPEETYLFGEFLLILRKSFLLSTYTKYADNATEIRIR